MNSAFKDEFVDLLRKFGSVKPLEKVTISSPYSL